MPPKNAEGAAANTTAITGFDAKETRFLAAAFVSQLGPGKFDYGLMASLTGNTKSSAQKMFPLVKRKAGGLHPSLATFLGGKEQAAAEPKKAKIGAPKRKKKEVIEDAEAGAGAETEEGEAPPKKKRGGRKAKPAKEEPVEEDENEENAA
ncbi:hypothetical protein GQ43DRAFT_264331 [Delitschia confertaspora ATCC 74209]|uniref:Uncharacterized protein n=1 Tax=Delitschia confertaspora ATCC 74209 TaxID=1513339 RepID=A0A9P4JBP0_9PLEO|nr:hypothetical protein GQ43DRAFT_264331 [Delitschia confertaspora ATCC 74209]